MFGLFNFDIKKILLVVFVLALPILSINMQKGPDEPPWYAQPVSALSGAIQSTYTGLSLGVRDTVSQYLNLVNIKVENRMLVRENAELRAKLNELTELKMENERLNQLLDFQRKGAIKLLAARVVGQDLFGEHSTIRIHRGSNDGVKKGMAVITFEGVVGYVFNAEPKTSQVLVMTDRYAVVDALVQRSRARGIVEGISPDLCRLKYLNRTDDVLPGDLVVTSGLDNIFPKGFPIGTIVDVESKKYGVTKKVELKPIVDPTRLEEVFVVFKVDTNVVAAVEQVEM